MEAPEFQGKSGIEAKSGQYADWVYQGDHMLGQLLDALQRTGQSNNTLVIATGHNGAAKRPYAPLREAKSSIYEGGHREVIRNWRGLKKNEPLKRKRQPDLFCPAGREPGIHPFI